MVFQAKPKPKKKLGRPPTKIPGVDGKKQAPFTQVVNENTVYPDPATVQPVTTAEGKIPLKRTKPKGRPAVKNNLPAVSPPKSVMDIDISKVQNLWERWPNESHDDYGSFEIFMKLGPNRTVREVARTICKTPDDVEAVNKLTMHLYDIAQKMKWDERIIARDRFLQRIEDEEEIKLRKARLNRNYAMLDDAKDLLEKEIKALKLKRENMPEDRTIMSVTQFTNLLDAVLGKEIETAKAAKEKAEAQGQGGRKIVQQIVMVSADQVKEQLKAFEAAQPKAPDNNIVDAEFEVVEEGKDA
jgi:hypothetical protein